MFSNALSSFWVISSIAIFLTHILLSMTKDSGFISSLIYYVRRMFIFGKLKQNGNEGETNARHVKRKKDGGGNRQEETDIGQNDKSIVALEVPKSWFTHFYAVGAVFHLVLFGCLILILLGNPLPLTIRNIIHWIHFGSEQRGLDDNAWPVLMVFSLEFVQILRRLYECLFVSTFSKSTMSIVHYFYGIFLYSSFALGLLSSVKQEKLVFTYPDTAEIMSYSIGFSIFLWGTCYQHKSMLTFAALRKEKKDHGPADHHIPHGDLFEWVSCPHYLCEILIYLAFCLIFQFSNFYVLSVALFVCANQLCVSVLVHQWYKEHFSSYPVTRKAVIPYIL